MTNTLFPREGILEGADDSIGLLSDGEDALSLPVFSRSVFRTGIPGLSFDLQSWDDGFLNQVTDEPVDPAVTSPPKEEDKAAEKPDGPFEEVNLDDLPPISPVDRLPDDGESAESPSGREPEEIHGLEDGPVVPLRPADRIPGESDDSDGQPGNRVDVHPDPSPGHGGIDPPVPPVTDASPLEPEPDDEPDEPESEEEPSFSAEFRLSYRDRLTDGSLSYSGRDEPEVSDEHSGLLERLVSGVRDLVQGIFRRENEDIQEAFPVPELRPEALQEAPDALNPDRDFSAGYISQRDLENALGRESWTMCCAASFVYATQTKYPDLNEQAIYRAAGKAADTDISGGGGKCVESDGYVGEIWNYSQSFARELGLTEYVDTPERFATVKEAQDAGYEMMKIRYEGTIDDEPAQHHVFQLGSTVIDPAPGEGMNDFFDDGSAEIKEVMALEWYGLPDMDYQNEKSN